MTSGIDLGRPTAGDVIDLITDDHRRFERLLSQLRLATADRDAVRQAFAHVLIAHGEAEEELVYPVLRRTAEDVDAHDVEHGKEEHAEGNQALLALLELKGTETKAFTDAAEELSNLIAHHIAEEELSILEPARTETSTKVRYDLGAKWAQRRNELIDAGCGSLDNVRRIVAQAEKEGLLEDAE
ncbi:MULTISPECIES: hemerythrin domain-containing protein [unclassified Nocardioides]|jgi:hemerythrin-like domain-containing protein|uniref:hemerythrin domain-containing protein n=1 Tax=unclassified Nocardioides TaxID=2615069 RepID=UPI000702670F|nr:MULTISPECIES: hemerythrin domain-containing protein [unclassified Nocardioides]KRC51416.1 cation-binding protein [Nocardioides sp. Root79]KRC69026.1 cation-binding protein [Nocardioides sp. Root240]